MNSIMIRMQTVEAERKKAIEKDEKLQNDIKRLNEQLKQSQSELDALQARIAVLEAQVEAEQVEKKELEERVQSLIQEKQELDEKEKKEQEGLKSQYQRLMKERLNEERKQFEIKLKAATATHQDHDEINVKKPTHHSTPSISSRSSFDSSSTTPAVVSSILVERLQANIRQLENQLSFYQTQLQSSSQSRDELSEEMLSMSHEIEQLRKETKKTNQLEQELEQLNARYQTLLELLGERTEEVEELKADLQDVKEMYKSQIIDLVQKIDQLKKQ
jgi:predicted RNase H-like nuclease (RuvC/YqgF family)